MKRNKITFTLLSVFVSISLLVSISACSQGNTKVQAADLMDGISPQSAQEKEIDELFVGKVSKFYFDLFRESVNSDENSLISPLSVLLALSMTANGADNDTLLQMQNTIAGGIPISELNKYLYTYVKNLPSEKNSRLNIANSIWFRDDEDRLHVEKDFLQRNADYFGAAAYKADFNSPATLTDINNWVKDKTEGMIEKILEEIREDAVMYLINAIVFEAKWETVYNKEDISEGEFTTSKGIKESATFLNSEESKFISGINFRGFLKPYEGNKYSFAAFLPDENITLDEFISSFDGEVFVETMKNVQETNVIAALPKFSYDYTVSMNKHLIDLGMKDAFNGGVADFSKLGQSSRGNLYIGEVLHKTFISVDELGTKAGAVTKVEIRDEAAPMGEYVILNRPFVYAIIDNATKLPVFIGTVLSVS